MLSEETVAAMRSRRETIEILAVPDQGHAPLLTGPEVIRRITGFVASCDGTSPAMAVAAAG